ncbi:MAG: hypothetical protein KAG56_06325 [Sulfurovaceae bacterium]|nr:hypothetical protein [Sulfurovaceae bacterium]
MNFTGNSSKKLLVHHQMDEIEVGKSIDIVLSPQFYTFLREDLEIKFAYQAKNIAPAFFDDYLNDELEHQYHVYKNGDEWYFFAYSIDEITSFLEEKGVGAHQIGKIYFVQELENSLIDPVKLSDTVAMQTFDGTVTLLPQRFVESGVEYQLLNFDKEKFKNGIAISSSYDSLIPLKETALLTLLLLSLGTFFLFEGSRGRASIENLQLAKDELLEKNPKLSSALRRNSELKKYEKIDKVEREKRKALMKISKMIGHKNRLKSLILTDNNIIITITTRSKQATETIKKMAKLNSFTLSNETAKEISLEKKL